MSANKARGTRWESAIVDYLREHGHPHAERRALSGALDRGDISGIVGVVIEAKDHGRMALAEWMDETEAERKNANAQVGVLVVKRRGKGASEAYCIVPLSQMAGLLA